MKMINNYLNSFETYLPEESSKEIREEFESSLLEQIEDKEQHLGRALNEQEQEELLLKIGHPVRVASAYLPNQELISRDYFPAYKRALEISLSVFAVLTLLSVLPFKLGTAGILTLMISLFASVISVSMNVFLVVTGIFYLMQRYDFDLNTLYAWSPKKLSSNVSKISLSRFEVFFEMAFEGLFLVIWNRLFLSESIWINNGFIENFSMSENWSIVYLPVNIVVGASFLLNIFKLTNAHWNRWMLNCNLVINAASLILLTYIAQFDQYFIASTNQLDGFDWARFNYYAELNVRIVIGIIMAIIIWDSYSHIKKMRAS
jgi:uncharacterized membrane protein